VPIRAFVASLLYPKIIPRSAGRWNSWYRKKYAIPLNSKPYSGVIKDLPALPLFPLAGVAKATLTPFPCPVLARPACILCL